MAQRLAAVLRILDCHDWLPAQDERRHHPTPFPLEAVLSDHPIVDIRQFSCEFRRILHGDREANTMCFLRQCPIIAELMRASDLEAGIMLKMFDIIDFDGEEAFFTTKPKTRAHDWQHRLHPPDIQPALPFPADISLANDRFWEGVFVRPPIFPSTNIDVADGPHITSTQAF